MTGLVDELFDRLTSIGSEIYSIADKINPDL